jgi:hypothetical protein
VSCHRTSTNSTITSTPGESSDDASTEKVICAQYSTCFQGF